MLLRVDDFYRMTLRQFFNALNGFRKLQNEQAKNDWYRARLIAYQVYLGTPLKKGCKHKSIDKYLPFEFGG